MLNVKDYIFILIIFTMFYITAKSSCMYNGKYSDLAILGVCALSTGIIVLIYICCKINNNDIKDTFTFELPPEKLCSGGSYMWSSNPEKQKMCSQFSPTQMSKYNCGKGYNGRPVNWTHTNMSDDKWENKMCSEENQYTDPQVL